MWNFKVIFVFLHVFWMDLPAVLHYLEVNLDTTTVYTHGGHFGNDSKCRCLKIPVDMLLMTI